MRQAIAATTLAEADSGVEDEVFEDNSRYLLLH